MKQMYYCCIDCNIVFGCYNFQKKRKIHCWFCDNLCVHNGTHKSKISEFALSHGLCIRCYREHRYKMDLQKITEQKTKEAQNEKRM